MKCKILLGLCMLFLVAGLAAGAPPMPRGIDGIVYELDAATEAETGTNFSICNLNNSFCIAGTTGSHAHSGRFSAAISGQDMDLIIVRAWNQWHESNRSVLLNGSMHGVHLLLDSSPPDNSPPTKMAAGNSPLETEGEIITQSKLIESEELEQITVSAYGLEVTSCKPAEITKTRPEHVLPFTKPVVAYVQLEDCPSSISGDGIELYAFTHKWEKVSKITGYKTIAVAHAGEILPEVLNQITSTPSPKFEFLEISGVIFKYPGRDVKQGTRYSIQNLNTSETVAGSTGIMRAGGYYAVLEGSPEDELILNINSQSFKVNSAQFNVTLNENPITGFAASTLTHPVWLAIPLGILVLIIWLWRKKK